MLLWELPPGLAAYLLFVAVLLGLAMGSFAACMADRIAAGGDFLRGRSRCDSCGHVLSARELIPVVSWLMQKGRCRWCGAKIPVRCPLTELLCAAAFAGIALRYGVTLRTAQDCVLTVLLLAVALVDYDTGLIPDGLLLAMAADWLLFTPFAEGGFLRGVGAGLLSGAVASVPLLLLSLGMDRVLQRESMGGGDLKFFFAAGLFFPWQQALFLIIACCVLGLLFAAFSGKKTGDPENPKAFPFGPAISAGVYLSLLAAQPVTAAYLGLFF